MVHKGHMNRETESGEKGKQTLSAQNITDNILVVHETHNMNKGVRMRCKPENDSHLDWWK